MITPSLLNYMAVEVSWGSTWVNLNDHENYQISAEGTRDGTNKSHRKVEAQSMVLGGSYLVHAVPDMVAENVTVRVFGQDQSSLADNYFALFELMEQYDFRIRWTFDDYREYWRCSLADSSASRNQVWTHSLQAVVGFQVPRFPNIERERI